MPIVDVTHAADIASEERSNLAQMLPHLVSLAVECPEEPYDHALKPGDVPVRFHSRGSYDVGGLDLIIEVHSKWFASRAETRQERCGKLCEALSSAFQDRSVGVNLSLPVAAWSQTD
jgi:hypothetical protein